MNRPQGAGTEDLAKEQSPQGAFPAWVHRGRDTTLDWNGFTTAQMLRALRRSGRAANDSTVRSRAIQYLCLCASSTITASYSFWPDQYRPPWARHLPPDSDDTALITLELMLAGHLDRRAVVHTVCKTLIPNRLQAIDPPAPPWLGKGAFLTWLGVDGARNILDCTANANVIALLAAADLKHLPGYEQAVAMIAAGIAWSGNSRQRLASLSPFYPDPAELLFAVDHAVSCGATELIDARTALHSQSSPSGATNERPICGSAYGLLWWTSPLLQTTRGC